MKISKYYFILFIITFAAIPIFFATRSITKVLTQVRDQKQKQINKFDYGNEPVELVDIKAGGLNVESGKNFSKEKDWLSDFSVTFRNRSDKSIVYLKLALDFPETKSTSSALRFPLTYGVRPLPTEMVDRKGRLDQKQNIDIANPRDLFQITLSDDQFKSMKTIVERRQSFDGVTKLDMFIEFILFKDGTAWSGGHFMVPDPARPGSFYPIGYDKDKFIPVKPNQ